MTATILLIRHAAHDDLGDSLSGRAPDRPLSSIGTAQAKQLARHLAGQTLKSVQSSPVLRARQTADMIAANDPVEIVPALDEIDFGDWTGARFTTLAGDPLWHEWNSSRAAARAPRGETMAAAQARAVAHVDTSAAANPDATLAMVSHCDIVRGIVAHYLGLSLDNMLRFDIDPASVTTLHVGDWGGRVVRLNEVAA